MKKIILIHKAKMKKIILIIYIQRDKNYLKYLMKNSIKIFFKKLKNNKWNFIMSKLNI